MGLELKDVSKTFIDKKAVDNISFKIGKPGVFALLGTNGAGKTTTIRMMLGIIKKDTGTITWDGKAVDRKNVKFGYLPEERGIYPKTKIVDQLEYLAKLKGMSKAEANKSIDYWLEKLKMTEYKFQTAEKLSKVLDKMGKRVYNIIIDALEIKSIKAKKHKSAKAITLI